MSEIPEGLEPFYTPPTVGNVVPRLSAVVWPPYIGLGNDITTWLPVECRAQIQWRDMCVEHGIEAKCKCLDPRKWTFAGKAMCWVPTGEYTRFLFFHSPNEGSTAMKLMDHPFIQPYDCYVPIDPIINDDALQNKISGIVR